MLIALRKYFLATVVAAAILSFLLFQYGKMDLWIAATVSVVYTGALWLCSRALSNMGNLPAKVNIPISVIVLLACLSLSFIAFGLAEGFGEGVFISDIPLMIIFGYPFWCYLSRGTIELHEEEKDFTTASDNGVRTIDSPDIFPADGLQTLGAKLYYDTINIKDGPSIHMVEVDKLLYVRSYGDYVWLHTEVDKFMKEETMKHMEANLPENFIRIHRTCIVNGKFISGVELHGKETYNVRLRNGTALRASVSGYKLLRDKLSL